MAYQIPKIKSKRKVLQLKPPRLCFQTLMVCLWVFVASICSVKTATCPSSIPSSAAMTTEQCSFAGYNIQTSGIAVGPVSNSLYYLYFLYTPNNAVVRKVDVSGSQTWMASFGFYPILKSLSVDAAEQSLYLASKENPLVVLKLTASGGSIVSQNLL